MFTILLFQLFYTFENFVIINVRKHGGKSHKQGTPLVVQWLRTHFAMQGM